MKHSYTDAKCKGANSRGYCSQYYMYNDECKQTLCFKHSRALQDKKIQCYTLNTETCLIVAPTRCVLIMFKKLTSDMSNQSMISIVRSVDIIATSENIIIRKCTTQTSCRNHKGSRSIETNIRLFCPCGMPGTEVISP